MTRTILAARIPVPVITTAPLPAARHLLALRRTVLAFPVHAHRSPGRLAAAYDGVL